ncbi:MAG: type II toxin-antitoxin system RelE/ParE family toxin [Deltaproteobacteria bacterium]|nr:type II toxin-antitoxin system RelE/ParE family toxin [Deltaproteobacteria bacterium]
MTRRVVLVLEAQAELEAATVWYFERNAKIADDFQAEIVRLSGQAAAMPLAFARTAESGVVRRAVAKRFPYSVFFTETATGILVLAVAHAKRRPGYWLGRLPA